MRRPLQGQPFWLRGWGGGPLSIRHHGADCLGPLPFSFAQGTVTDSGVLALEGARLWDLRAFMQLTAGMADALSLPLSWACLLSGAGPRHAACVSVSPRACVSNTSWTDALLPPLPLPFRGPQFHAPWSGCFSIFSSSSSPSSQADSISLIVTLALTCEALYRFCPTYPGPTVCRQMLRYVLLSND